MVKFVSSCCGNTGRLLHGICKYAGERIVAHGPLVLIFTRKQDLMGTICM